MDIRIKASDYELTSEVREYLDARIAAIARLVDESNGEARCEIELGRAVGHSQQGNVWRAEIVLQNKGNRSVATATAESVNAAIDLAKDEMLRQLRQHKDKNVSLVRRAGAKLKDIMRFGK